MKTAEEALTEQMRLHMISDSDIHNRFSDRAAELAHNAHYHEWQSSEVWSPFQSVVFTLEDEIQQWVEDVTESGYSVKNTLATTARFFVDYKAIAHEFVHSAICEILDDPIAESKHYLGIWDFRVWEETHNN